MNFCANNENLIDESKNGSDLWGEFFGWPTYECKGKTFTINKLYSIIHNLIWKHYLVIVSCKGNYSTTVPNELQFYKLFSSHLPNKWHCSILRTSGDYTFTLFWESWIFLTVPSRGAVNYISPADLQIVGPAFQKPVSPWKLSRKASLVARWLRICLPMQGTRIRALVWEDPTCRGATGPVSHNYWACALEPMSHNYWACAPQQERPR